MNKLFRGKVVDGRFKPNDLDGFKEAIQCHEGHYVDIIVQKPEKDRSVSQQAYYRGVVIPLVSEATGFERDECHKELRIMFLTDMTSNPPHVRSTTSLTTVEFVDYIERIQRFAAIYLDTFIPDPLRVDYRGKYE